MFGDESMSRTVQKKDILLSVEFAGVIMGFCSEFSLEQDEVETEINVEEACATVHLESKKNSSNFKNYLFLFREKEGFEVEPFQY